MRPPVTADDYNAFCAAWNTPADGLHGYLIRFLEAPDPTFQHIAVWTIVQLLESGDARLDQAIRASDQLLPQVRALLARAGGGEDASVAGTSTTGSEKADSIAASSHKQQPRAHYGDSDTEEESEEESDGEIVVLAKKILEVLDP